MLFECSSKSFLLGEYLALRGGPCLLVATEPRFELHINKKGKGNNIFHPASPAGRLWDLHKELTKNWSASFNSPFGAGVGASSAEFLLLHSAIQVNRTLSHEAQHEPDLMLILKDFSEMSEVKASGADLVAQLKGGVTLFERNLGKIRQQPWGFQDLSFLFFSTGVKVPTHEHLASLGSWSDTALSEAVEKGVSGWLYSNPEAFASAVNATRRELQALGFEAPTTTAILAELQRDSRIVAAKGCGALGADTVLLLCKIEHRDELRESIGTRLKFLASELDISRGLEFSFDAMNLDKKPRLEL